MADSSVPVAQDGEKGSFRTIAIVVVIAILALTIGLVVVGILLVQNSTDPATVGGVQMVRDMFIILLALELLIIGAALIVLLVQLAQFVNLLSNEIGLILTSATDTVNAVRGTAIFLSKNLSEPLIRTGSTLAGIRRATQDATFLKSVLTGAAAGVMAAVEVNMKEDEGSDKTEQEETNGK